MKHAFFETLYCTLSGRMSCFKTTGFSNKRSFVYTDKIKIRYWEIKKIYQQRM